MTKLQRLIKRYLRRDPRKLVRVAIEDFDVDSVYLFIPWSFRLSRHRLNKSSYGLFDHFLREYLVALQIYPIRVAKAKMAREYGVQLIKERKD